ncbi:hypothetical protein LCGC14_2320940 [marine sediment metagenome]|uniref:Uncharacterized protein n=1 Tax=marine sediment metagenome TaxID=412755 RepID=A0A0F9D5C0_9ZZZZ
MSKPSVTVILKRGGRTYESETELNAWDFFDDCRAQDIFDLLCARVITELTDEEKELLESNE